jgi:spore germination protein
MRFLKRKLIISFMAAMILVLAVIVILGMRSPAGNGNISATNKPGPATSFFGKLIGSNFHSLEIEHQENQKTTDKPEISGWIAWWKETDGLAVVEKHSSNLSCVSPGWLKLDKQGKLVETGKMDKMVAAKKIKDSRIKLFPMLATDFSDKELSDFMKDRKVLDNFVTDLIGKLKEYQADGLDLDFENIGAAYTSDFSFLVTTLGEKLKKNNLRFSVVVQAQTGKNDWEGLKGQDLSLISKYADELRIMAYDRHGEFSPPGPITPMDWYADILDYNLKFIPREKIVIGLPTYGYLWKADGGFDSFQYMDFVSYLKNNIYEEKRDPVSYELNYTSDNGTGWLSDSISVINKIEFAKKTGINRFIIWNLGGTDEKIFSNQWKT